MRKQEDWIHRAQMERLHQMDALIKSSNTLKGVAMIPLQSDTETQKRWQRAKDALANT